MPMPFRKSGPLSLAQKEGDALKRKVDKLISDCEAYLKKNKVDEKKRDILFKSCQNLLKDAESLILKLEQLKPENEPVKVDRYEEKKSEESSRLLALKEKLIAMELKMKPIDEQANDDAVSEARSTPRNKKTKEKKEEKEVQQKESGTAPVAVTKNADVKKKSDDKEEEEDDDDDDDDDDDEDDDDDDDDDDDEDDDDEEEEEEESEEEESEEGEENEEQPQQQAIVGKVKQTNQFVALGNFDGEEPGDLCFKSGEILTILSKRDDGWMEARNKKGEVGWVPGTYLQPGRLTKKTDQEQEEEESEEDEEETEDNEEDEEEEAESEEGESEEGESETEEETETSVKRLEEKSDDETSLNQEAHWKDIKKGFKKADVNDVLKALGTLPAGFRDSTLAKLKKTEHHDMKHYLAPKLSASCVSYHDLHLDHQTNKIRPINAQVQRVITLTTVVQAPVLPADLLATSRHVRICLFDGKVVLSNIISIKVAIIEKDQKTWHFAVKPDTKCVEYGELFIRSNLPNTNLGVLFEICFSYRKLNTGEEGEVSCGWVFLKLYDERGAFIQNKTYEEHVKGGTPYEKGIDVDPAVAKKDTGNLLRNLVAVNRQARLIVRLSAPTKEQKDLLDTLPEVIIGNTAYIQYMSFYRQILADLLLRDRQNLQSTEPIHSPVAAVLPEILEQPDLMDVLRAAWAESIRTATRAEKRDGEIMKARFMKALMNNVYSIHFLTDLQPFTIADSESLKSRAVLIQKAKELNAAFAAACLLSPDVKHKPFDVSELSFSITHHCIVPSEP